MAENQGRQQMKSLRISSPKLYHYIISGLEAFNIHSYDVLLEGIKEKTGIRVVLHYGQNFTQNKMAIFSFKTIEEHGNDLKEFINEVSADCKKTMIDDYFNQMAP